MRRLLHVSCVLALTACGSGSSGSSRSSPPATAPATTTAPTGGSVATDFLAQIATAPRVRDVCQDPNEPALRELLPSLFPCAPTTHLGYVVARTTAGTVLVVGGRQGSTEASPAARVTWATFVDGRAVDDLPVGAPSSEVDRRALFLAAALAAADDPRVAIEGPGAMDLVPAAARPYVEGAFHADEDAHHASLIFVTPRSDVGELVRVERRVASIDDEGRVSVSDDGHAEWIAHTSEHGGCSPRLEALAVAAPLETVSSPRALCGDAQEAAIRQRMPALPPCDRIASALHLVARTPGDLTRSDHPPVGEMIVVVWGRESTQQSVFSEGCVGNAMGSAFVNGGDDTRAMLEAAILSLRGTTDYATSVAAIPTSVPRAVRARLAQEHLGLTANGLIAVTWPHDGDDRMLRYEARHDEFRAFPVFVYELLPRGGERLVRDPYEGVSMGALDGL